MVPELLVVVLVVPPLFTVPFAPPLWTVPGLFAGAVPVVDVLVEPALVCPTAHAADASSSAVTKRNFFISVGPF